MLRLLSVLYLVTIFYSGCSQYKDPKIAQRIHELENKEELDDFDKEELKDLKEQGKYHIEQINKCAK